ncbi:hypothetical protein K1W54_08590 [Micromonospora sp. CPCC 205371]|nr:hypothetical protein [Micromonospora sp. CPCC 205371]
MRSLELSERERALILWERARQLHEYPSEDDAGCSAFFTDAANATEAGMAAYAAGAYEKASGAFSEAQKWLNAGEACLLANAKMKKPPV